MTYRSFIKVVANEANIPQAQVKEILDSSFSCLKSIVASGEEVKLHQFGTFRKTHVKSAVKKTAFMKEEKMVPAYNKVAFCYSKDFKTQINS